MLQTSFKFSDDLLMDRVMLAFSSHNDEVGVCRSPLCIQYGKNYLITVPHTLVDMYVNPRDRLALKSSFTACRLSFEGTRLAASTFAFWCTTSRGTAGSRRMKCQHLQQGQPITLIQRHIKKCIWDCYPDRIYVFCPSVH